MTALKTYKRKPAPTLQQPELVRHQAIIPGRTLGTPAPPIQNEALTNYIADELQQLENTLTIHGQATTSIEDGVTTIKQNIIDITNTTGTNTAAISQEATTRTSADSALATLVTNLTATVATGDSTNAAAISNELTVRANADSALATTVSNLTAAVTSGDNSNAAAISSEATARANADSALASTASTLAATVTNGDNANAAAISSEATARANADSAAATTVSNLTATVTSGDNTNAAAISSEATARANADSALSSSVSSLTSTVNGVSASVTTEQNARVAADNTLLAKYGVTLNSNGYITGFSQNNNGTTGTFKILADKFTIIDPSDSSGEAGTQVFDITGGNVTMDAAHIKDLSVSTVKIQNNAVSVSTFAKHNAQSGLSNKTFSTTVSMPAAGTITVICKAGVQGGGSSATVSIELTIDGTAQDGLNAQGSPALANHLLLGSKDVSSGNRVITVNYTNLANTFNPSQKADFIILRRFK